MSIEQKKFLDEEGLKVLWNQVNLNDYPNNETLIAVINAIDETKANKNYVDEAILDNYIKYRTHWVEHATTILDSEVFECTILASDSESYYCTKTGNIGLVDGVKYNITVNGTIYTSSALIAFGTNDIALIADIEECRIYDRSNGVVEVFTDSSKTLTISIATAEDLYVKLDERFIPDVFARSDDVNNKMNKENPSGIGSFSINRANGSVIGENSISIGTNSVASGPSSTAIGSETNATGFAAHAEGSGTVASGDLSHAEGQDSKATGYAAHAESSGEANGDYSHASGYSIADGDYSYAVGNGTWAVGRSQVVMGEGNIEDSSEDASSRGTYAFIIGNGDMETMDYSNATTLDWEGNAWFAGDIYVGSTSGINKDEGSKKLATEEYVNNSTISNVQKYFLVVETVKDGANYLLDGITFQELYDKFQLGNVNIVCHVDGTDYIPLLSVTSYKIIFSGIYNTTSVSLDFDSNGVGTLTTSYLSERSSLTSHASDKDIHITAEEREKWDAATDYIDTTIKPNAEIWTFTLADGSTINKTILLGESI